MVKPCCCLEKRRLVDAYTAAAERYANAIGDRRVLAGCITGGESERVHWAVRQAHEACHDAWSLLSAHITGHACRYVPLG